MLLEARRVFVLSNGDEEMKQAPDGHPSSRV